MRRVLTVVFVVIGINMRGLGQREWVKMDVRPLFGTSVLPYSCVPLKIRLRNEGPSVKGKLVVNVMRPNIQRLYLFPLTLPTGTVKELLALPFTTPDTMSITVRLEGVRHPLERLLPLTVDETIRVVIGLGDEVGGLEFLRELRPKVSKPNPPFSPSVTLPPFVHPHPIAKPFSLPPVAKPSFKWELAYCRPEDFPDKVASLSGVSVLVLSPGSERLRGKQWEAIRGWVMMGGVLVVPGGSGAIVLRHRALATILPVTNFRTFPSSQGRSLARWLGVPAPSRPTFITTGTPTDDAEVLVGDRFPLIAVRPFGWGVVVFFAFNLWDKPFRGWGGSLKLWEKVIYPYVIIPPATFWGEHLREPLWGLSWKRTPAAPSPLMSHQRLKRSDFELQLPGVFVLLLTLLIYFFLVVPVSYFLLRRRRCLDWYWVLAPTLALSFVFFVGRWAFGLYRIDDQNRTKGILVMAANHPDAYLFAVTTLFLRKGGIYTVDLDGAESVFAAMEGGFMPSPIKFKLETIEGRRVLVPMRVSNLSFRQLLWSRPLSPQGFVGLTARREGGKVHLRGVNALPFHLKDVRLALRGWRPFSSPSPSLASFFPIYFSRRTIAKEWAPGERKEWVIPWTEGVNPIGILRPGKVWVTLYALIEGMNIAPDVNIPTHPTSAVWLELICPIREKSPP